MFFGTISEEVSWVETSKPESLRSLAAKVLIRGDLTAVRSHYTVLKHTLSTELGQSLRKFLHVITLRALQHDGGSKLIQS